MDLNYAWNSHSVIPAQAGIHSEFEISNAKWIPAYAGMTR